MIFRNINRIFIYFHLLILCVSIYSQNKYNNYTTRHFTIKDGLSQSTIKTIIQDKKGFLWFGTINGLNRFDGHTFKIYNYDLSDSNSISDDGITGLFEDKEGYIWVGTAKGILNKFERETGNFKKYFLYPKTDFEYEDKFQKNFPIVFSRNNPNTITTLAEDKYGLLWVGTWQNGVYMVNKKTGFIEHFYSIKSDSTSLSSNNISNIFIDSNGEIWIATIGSGVNRVVFDIVPNWSNQPLIKYKIHFDQYKFDKNSMNSISENYVITIYEDKFKSMWFGTYSSGLNKLSFSEKYLKPKQAKFKKYFYEPSNSNSISDNSIMAIDEDEEFLWIGTFGGGLNRFDFKTEKFTRFKKIENDNSISSNEIISLLVDKANSIWVGTHLGEGIDILQKTNKKFNLLNNKNSCIKDNIIWAINSVNDEDIWIGTFRGGLTKYNIKNGDCISFTYNPNDNYSLNDNHIRSVAFAQNKDIWIGTYNNGLNKYSHRTNKFYHFTNNPLEKHSISNNQIQNIYIDNNSVVWVGTFGGGLNYFHTDSTYDKHNSIKFKNYQHNPNDSNSLSDNRVYKIYEDKEGILWIGTFGGGLNKFNRITRKFKRYQHDVSSSLTISDDRILSIHEDESNNLWIGTFGGGLNKFDKKSEIFTHIIVDKEFASQSIYGILEDNNKNLWLSTDNGIYMYNEFTGQLRNYDLTDGLQSLEFSGGAYYKNKIGELYFGGINGLNYFYPDSLKTNSYIPPIEITEINIFDVPIKEEVNSIRLNYDENYFSFKFSALDYINPNENNYAYILEPFEKKWNYTNSLNRIASYSNIPSGKYKFKVKNSNNDGIWNEQCASVDIIILPPFWKTWWFITLGIIFLITTTLYIFYIRYNQIKQIKSIKSKLSADLHDNIGAGLTEISIWSEISAMEILKFSENTAQQVKNISEKARHLTDEMSDIVWVINPERDSLYELLVRLKTSYSELFAHLGISIIIRNLEAIKNIKLKMDFKQNLYLILREALNNSIKHSSCSKIEIDINLIRRILKVKITDNGIGIESKNNLFGHGLKNMQMRAKAIGGRLNYFSNKNKGTSIEFMGKISNIYNLKKIYNNIFKKKKTT
ncbi:MAG: hypothetical protein JW866_02650 [Ignavibacteriales bacterium]|nr:hypothetical protein [Ignavibacteriales bacterium]